jgi:importin subunit beta-1
MSIMQQAAATRVPPDDEDLVDYLNELREGIFEAFSGIIQGLRTDNKGTALLFLCILRSLSCGLDAIF